MLATTSHAETLRYGDYLLAVAYITTEDQQSIALLRVGKPQPHLTAVPLVCLHGSYSNRHFWLSDRGIGLAAYLFEQGFDVWILEFRGHGLSPKGDKFKRYSAQDWGQYDLPAAQQHVYSATQKKAFFMGHSAGGVNLLLGLSGNYLQQHWIAGVILLGVQVNAGHEFLRNPLIYRAIQLYLFFAGYFPAPKLKYGPEIESPAFMLQMINWRRTDRWLDSAGHDVWLGLKALEMPLLHITSDGDTQDPKQGVKKLFDYFAMADKEFICLGVAQGYSKDYTHPGMVVDKKARQEVWPKINQWLHQRS